MGKQVNYYMNYESFLQVAQAAIDSGCLIIRREHSEEIIKPTSDISVVTPECSTYFFYLPELGELAYKTDIHGKYFIDYSFNQTGLAVIEASFSKNSETRARLYVMTGFYDQDGHWVARSERITKVYDKLARKAKKVAQRVC